MSTIHKNLVLGGKRDVRLLYIHPAAADQPLSADLKVVCLDVKPSYIALSYAWGPPHFDAEIICNGETFRITSNLHAALVRMRRTSKQVFWVDQICIDQDNVSEKGHQVALMASIYKNSENVYIWLGPHNANTLKGIRYAQTWASNVEFQAPFETDQNVLRGFDSLFESPYFTRYWVIQEAAMQKDALAFCGDHEVLFRDLGKSVMRETTVVRRTPRNDTVRRGKGTCLGLFVVWETKHGSTEYYPGIDPKLVAKRRTPHREEGALSIMVDHHLHDLADPRDRVYALLGLIDDNNFGIVPDYSLSVEDVYREFSEQCVLSGLGTILITTWAGTTSDSKSALPSWCLDLLQPFPAVPVNRMATGVGMRFKAGGKLRDTTKLTDRPGVLSVTAAFVDTVSNLASKTKQDFNSVETLWGLERWLGEVNNLAMSCSSAGSETSAKIPHSMLLARVCARDYRRYLENHPHDALGEFAATIMKYAFHIKQSPNKEAAFAEVEKSSWQFFNTPYVMQLQEIIKNRRLGYTSSKRLMGCFPRETQVGDQVFIVAGGRVPVVLRPLSENEFGPNSYKLIGDSFVLDIMDGQFLKQDSCRPKTIFLR